MTGDAVELARIILETRGADYPFVGDRHAQLARAVLEQHEALKLAGTSVGDAYQHRSEHQRLLHSDVTQGKRIAELTAERDQLRTALREALDQIDMHADLLTPGIAWELERKAAELRKLLG